VVIYGYLKDICECLQALLFSTGECHGYKKEALAALKKICVEEASSIHTSVAVATSTHI
jgi:hypothetical protein